jgi:ATP-dependent Clp endopeptidase proteolytic subunit ClpP
MKKRIQFYGEIGWELDGEWLSEELEGLKQGDEAVLDVHSPGGSVFEGNLMYNLLQQSPATIHADIIGLCASMATVIVSGCARVRMAENSLFMIHQPSTGGWGNANDLEREVEILRKLENIMLANYAKKTGQTVEALREKYFDGNDHWLTAEEALAEGFIDELMSAPEASAPEVLDGHAPQAQTYWKKFAALAASPNPNNPMSTQPTPATEPIPADNKEKTPAGGGNLQEVVASQQKDIDRLKQEVDARDARIKALNGEKDQILQKHAEEIIAKDEKIKNLTADHARVAAEKEGLQVQIERLGFDNTINLALSTLRGSNGKPLSENLIGEIKQNFKAQHRLSRNEAGEEQVFSIARDATLDMGIAQAVVEYAYGNQYVAKPQTGNGFVPSAEGGHEMLSPREENKRKWAKTREELRRAHVAMLSDDWYRKMHAVGYPEIPEDVKERLKLG